MQKHVSRKKKTAIGVLAAVGVIALAAAIVVLFSRLEKKNDAAPEGAGLALSRENAAGDKVEGTENTAEEVSAGEAPDDETAEALLYNGKKYVYNKDLVTLLILGVDKKEVEEYVPTKNDSHVDFLVLAVFDPNTRTCTLLQLDRDTMCNVMTLQSDEQYDYVAYEQLSYAHAYGDGLEESCENTVKTVSYLLYGAKIDNYFSLTLDAIPILNDLVGGVTVTIEDDFSAVDDSLVMGETVTLTSENVEHFVRARKTVGDGLNLSRMRRQREYMTGLIGAMRTAAKDNPGFVLDLYGAIADSLVTDCTLDELADYADRFSGYALSGITVPEGELVQGEIYMEFYVDEAALQELVIETFYVPVD